jgi:hypothetical protein
MQQPLWRDDLESAEASHPPGLQRSSSGRIRIAGARTLRNAEDMRHPPSIWTEPSNADYPLPVLRDAYVEHLAGRTRPASRATIHKYVYSLLNFERSLLLQGEPLVLASLTPFAIERWISDCRAGRITTRVHRHYGPRREDTIGLMLPALKAFSHKYVYRHLEMSTGDLLERVERYTPAPPVKEGLSTDQLEVVSAVTGMPAMRTCATGHDRLLRCQRAALPGGLAPGHRSRGPLLGVGQDGRQGQPRADRPPR